MTLSEIKSGIVSKLNQEALNVIVHELATITLQHEQLKAEHEALKKTYEADQSSKATKKK